MPIIKSAIKRVKLSEKQRQKNFSYKAKVRTLVKKFENSITSQNIEDAKQNFQKCISILDKAAQKRILEKNTVSRKKALLSKKLLMLSQTNQDKDSQVGDEKKE